MGTKTNLLLVALGVAIYRQWHENAILSMGTFRTTVAVFCLNWMLYMIWRTSIHPHFFSPLSHFPSAPGGNFFTGHTMEIIRKPTGALQKEWVDSVPNEGIIRYRMWFKDRLLLTSPKALSEVLVQKNYEFVKPQQVRNGLIRILGEGILLAEGDEHKRQRKGLMPAFAYRHVKDLYPIFWDKTREMVECMAKEDESEDTASSAAEDTEKPGKASHPGAIEVNNFASRATLDIVGLAGMGNDFNSLRNPNNTLNVMYRTVFNPGRIGSILAIIGVFVPFWIMARLPVKRNSDIRAASNYIKDLCLRLITKKRADMAEKSQIGKDIISVALESGSFTDEQLVNQCMTFLAAGHETTATAMTWALFLLCRYPEVQKKLREEIHEKLPSIDSTITAAEIDHCSYLHAVCLEVLRLRSPVNLTLRTSTCDTTICGKFVPKGTLIILAPSAINCSTQLWGPDAREFNPERWLDKDGTANNHGSADSNFSFLTFLHGPRSCIGQRFAQAEFACLLAGWVGRFETTLEEGSPLATGEPETVGGVTIKPKGGLWVKLKRAGDW